MNEVLNEIDERIKLSKIKKELDDTTNMGKISDIVGSLSEKDAKELLKMYIYEH